MIKQVFGIVFVRYSLFRHWFWISTKWSEKFLVDFKYGVAVTLDFLSIDKRVWRMDQIIYDINSHFMEEVKRKYGNDYGRLARMSIIEEGKEKARDSAFLPMQII